jgi:UDP-glucose 4-epimerase
MRNQWSGKRVLVTGGCGFVGSHLVDKLASLGAVVTVIDNLSTGNRSWLPSGVEFHFSDMRRGALSQAMIGQEFVFHLAAHADVRQNMTRPRKVWSNNVDATLTMLEVMRAEGVRGLAFASSGIVYRGVGSKETDALDADSIYGASKIACEHLIKSYEREGLIDAWRFRFAGLLGPRYTHGHVADFVQALKEHPDHLEVLGNGYQRKAYLDVRDCVNGMVEIVDTDSTGAYNLASGETLVIRDSVRQICDIMGLSPRVTYGDTAGGWPTDPPTIELGTRHKVGARPLGESLGDAVRWLAERAGRDAERAGRDAERAGRAGRAPERA